MFDGGDVTKREKEVVLALHQGMLLKRDNHSVSWWLRKPNAHWHEFGTEVRSDLVQRMRDSNLLFTEFKDGYARLQPTDHALASITKTRTK